MELFRFYLTFLSLTFLRWVIFFLDIKFDFCMGRYVKMFFILGASLSQVYFLDRDTSMPYSFIYR